MTKKLFLFILVVTSINLFGQTPILSNFRVENSNPDRVYFDSSEPVTATTTTGFIISGKTVSDIVINTGQLTDHYFTVSSAFDFWDNNTIRYEGGSNIQVRDFSLQHIKNNIVEPSADINRYASVSGSGSHDGTSEDNAWTLWEAASNARSGMTVWVKAGKYSGREMYVAQNGSVNSPIKFIGYKNSPGDITTMPYQYAQGNRPDPNEMPTIDEGNRTAGRNTQIRGDYIIMRNFQSININGRAFYATNAPVGVIFDNCVAHNAWTPNGTGFSFNSRAGKKNRVINSVAVNTSQSGVYFAGDFQLIENVKVYSDGTNLTHGSMWEGGSEDNDYYAGFDGSHNIMINVYAERVVAGVHAGHGLALKSDNQTNEVFYNLVEDSEVLGSGAGLELRHDDVRYNVVRNVKFLRGKIAKGAVSEPSGLVIRDDASYNTIENCTFDDIRAGIRFRDNSEEGTQPSGRYNKIINNLFINLETGIEATSGTDARVIGNKFINNTFYNVRSLYGGAVDKMSNLNNEFVNNIVFGSTYRLNTAVHTLGDRGPTETYNAYYNTTYTPPTGTGNVIIDPLFVNAASKDFRLQDSSPIKDSGQDRTEVTGDILTAPRYNGKYSIGAYEDTTPRVGSVTPNSHELCEGESVILTASGGTSYSWSTGETNDAITVTPTVTTTYSVTISDGTYTDSHDIEVVVNTPPSVDAGLDEAICEGDSITLTATGVGDFTWSNGETGASITVNPTSTTTYTVTASNSCSTDATDDVVVTVNPGVTLDAGPDVSICEGENITLTATGTGPFDWSTGETTATITVNPSTTTTYSITSANGDCSITDEVIVTVNTPPSADAGLDVAICEGDSITLTATGVGDFTWSNGETGASITVNPTSTTTYTVTAGNSCSTDATDDVVVTVNPGVTLDAGPDVSICQGENITLTATGTGPFDWSTGETTASITVNPASTTTYTIISANGDCSITDEVIVTVDTPPSVDAGLDVTICEGENVVLTATGSGDFTWSNGETGASIIVGPSTTTTYTVTASNASCVDVVDEVVVTVTPAIALTIDSNTAICMGETVTLTANANGTLLWSTGETTSSITVSPTSTTIYSVRATAGDCSDLATVEVQVNEVPSVDLGADRSICYGETITLRAEGSGSFLWSTGETTSSIIINPTTTTTYSVSASNSCATDATDEITVTVNPEITADAGLDVSICVGESTTLTATGTGPFNWSTGETTASITVNPTVTSTYTVSSGTGPCAVTDTVRVTVNQVATVNAGSDALICEGDTITLTASGTGNFVWSTGETTASIDVSPTTTTTYTVTASNTCATNATDEVTVTVNPEKTVDAGSDVSICVGESTTLTATGTGPFNWSTGETTASITVNPTNTTNYTVSSGTGPCDVTDTVRVTVNQVATVNAGSDVTICEGNSITLTASGTGNFLWSTGETTPSIEVTPTATSTYTVTASNSCATTVTDEIIVTVNPALTLDAGLDVSICSGESATLTATGTGPFNWSTGETTASIIVSPTDTTIYTVSSGTGPCAVTDTVSVLINQVASVDAGLDVTICEGDTITLTATGEGEFLWSTGETTASIDVAPTATTTYTVTASNSCVTEMTDEITVNVNETPVATANDDMTILSGSSVDLTVSGVGSFEWSTGEVGSRISISPTVTTTYTVTATTGEGCSVTDEIVVTVVDEYQPTVITITAGQNITICPGDTVIIEAPQGTRYLWNSGETDAFIRVSPSETTIYSVKVFNGDDSETSHSTITVSADCNEGISELIDTNNFDLDKDMIVYPNPTTGLLNVKLTGYDNDTKVTVYNLNGSMLYARSIDNKSRASVLREQLDLSNYPKGIYFIRLINNGNSQTKKVIVN